MSIHTGEGSAHMIITAQSVKTITMLHTCVGPADRPMTTQVNKISGAHKYVSTVEVLNYSSSNCHRRPWDNREQPCSTADSLRRDQQANSKNLGNTTDRTAFMGANTQAHPPQSWSQRSNSENPRNMGPSNSSSHYYRNNNHNYNYREL